MPHSLKQPAVRSLPPELEELCAALHHLEGLSELRGALTALPESLRAALPKCVRFNPDSYTRQIVHECDRICVMLLGWLPGQASEIHDHGGSVCALRVLQGVATERRFEIDAFGLAVERSRDDYLPGSVLGCDGADVHSLGNDPAASQPLVTLHVYRPAPRMNFYERAREVSR